MLCLILLYWLSASSYLLNIREKDPRTQALNFFSPVFTFIS